ncbi:hypothetical protein [Breoghania sp.]|uniref:hypothetical protein n=1 Tax=Breoghania sp. TaxID=2065378 RepID=UPI00261FF864|nr:hypothetical protein [Breoghania sp.]MDJ0932792.1 hypothetical protein [Breoghania sp.]
MCERWTQAFLDRLADVMSSVPENQRLTIPIWRSLLLNDLGPGVVRYAEETLAHTIKNATEAAYHWTDLMEQRREMMLEWESWMMGEC